MGRWSTKICINCQTVSKKRHNKVCHKCGGKLVLLTQELIEKICLMNEQREKRRRRKENDISKKITARDIW